MGSRALRHDFEACQTGLKQRGSGRIREDENGTAPSAISARASSNIPSVTVADC
jgi:hypothetical protein